MNPNPDAAFQTELASVVVGTLSSANDRPSIIQHTGSCKDSQSESVKTAEHTLQYTNPTTVVYNL